jgi:hypothetical protein
LYILNVIKSPDRSELIIEKSAVVPVVSGRPKVNEKSPAAGLVPNFITAASFSLVESCENAGIIRMKPATRVTKSFFILEMLKDYLNKINFRLSD